MPVDASAGSGTILGPASFMQDFLSSLWILTMQYVPGPKRYVKSTHCWLLLVALSCHFTHAWGVHMYINLLDEQISHLINAYMSQGPYSKSHIRTEQGGELGGRRYSEKWEPPELGEAIFVRPLLGPQWSGHIHPLYGPTVLDIDGSPYDESSSATSDVQGS